MKNIGKEFENKVEEALKPLRDKNKLAYLRLYDTHSAGNYLPQQPADFIVSAQGFTWLLECKASHKYSSLADGFKELVPVEQAAQYGIWVKQGVNSIVLFYAGSTGIIEAWKGKSITHKRSAIKTTLSTSEDLLLSFFEDELQVGIVKSLQSIVGAQGRIN
jgi:hypothetical protein